MVENIMPLFSQSLASAMTWLDSIMTKVFGWELWTSVFVMIMAVRFFIKPLLGSGSSDMARPRKGKGSEE